MSRDLRNKNENLDSFLGNRDPHMHGVVIEAVSPDKTASTIVSRLFDYFAVPSISLSLSLFSNPNHFQCHFQQQQQQQQQQI